MEQEKIVIVGGGIIGCATAYMLKKHSPSCQILLLDRNSSLSQECSYQNGGTLSYTFNQQWNHFNTIRSAIFSSKTSYYSFNPSIIFDTSFWFWAIRSIYSSLFPAPNTDSSIFTLGKRSSELHTTLRKELLQQSNPIKLEYLGNDLGLTIFYSTLQDFNKVKTRSLELNAKESTNIHVVATRKACGKYEPTIEDWGMEIVGCVKNHSDYLSAHDSHKLSLSLAQLAAKNGAILQFDADVDKFNVEDGKVVSLTLKNGQSVVADKFILCTGAETRVLGEKLGWAPPIWPVKGLTFNMKTSKKFHHTVYLYNEFPIYVTPLENNTYRVSAFAEFTQLNDYSVDSEKIKYLENKVTTSLNIKDAEFSSYWSCKRPVSSDDLPLIGKFPGLKNVYINAGHGSKGSIWCLSSAELVSFIILGKSPLIDPRAFEPSRFLI